MQDANFERLTDCFEQVFPTISRYDIPKATPYFVGGWDSVAQVTLLSLIGEVFAVDFSFEEFEKATSFDSILQLLRSKLKEI